MTTAGWLIWAVHFLPRVQKKQNKKKKQQQQPKKKNKNKKTLYSVRFFSCLSLWSTANQRFGQKGQGTLQLPLPCTPGVGGGGAKATKFLVEPETRSARILLYAFLKVTKYCVCFAGWGQWEADGGTGCATGECSCRFCTSHAACRLQYLLKNFNRSSDFTQCIQTTIWYWIYRHFDFGLPSLGDSGVTFRAWIQKIWANCRQFVNWWHLQRIRVECWGKYSPERKNTVRKITCAHWLMTVSDNSTDQEWEVREAWKFLDAHG